jgi:uncharacterized membrane protein
VNSTLPESAGTPEESGVPEPENSEDDAVQLPATIEHILEKLPAAERPSAEIVMRRMVAQYSGPVPHSGEMQRYGEIDPTFPERFMAMAERQVAHRHNLETRVVTDDFTLKRRGQDYALASTVMGLAVAVGFGFMGLPVVAGIVAGTTIVGVVTAFVVGRVKDGSSSAEADEEAE